MIVIIVLILCILLFLFLLGTADGNVFLLLLSLIVVCAGGYFLWDMKYKVGNSDLAKRIEVLKYSKQFPYGKVIKIEDYVYLMFRMKNKDDFESGEVIYMWAGENDKSMKLSDISCCLFYENGIRTKYCGTKNADPLGKPPYEYYIRLFSKDFKHIDFWPGKKELAYEAYEAFEYILSDNKKNMKYPFEYFSNNIDTE